MGKFGGHKVWQIDFSSTWRKKVWRINSSTNRLLIVSANLDGFSLTNHGRVAKFAKLACYTVIYFLCIPLHGLAFYSLNYPLCLFPSYHNHAFVAIYIFQPNYATIYLMYPLAGYQLKNLQA